MHQVYLTSHRIVGYEKEIDMSMQYVSSQCLETPIASSAPGPKGILENRITQLVNLPSLLPNLHINLQPRSPTILPNPLLQLKALSRQYQITFSHPQQRTIIIFPIPNIHYPTETIFASMRGEVRVEFVTFAHVIEAADGTIVRRSRGWDSSTDMQPVGLCGIPVCGIGNDLGEEVGKAVFLDLNERLQVHLKQVERYFEEGVYVDLIGIGHAKECRFR